MESLQYGALLVPALTMILALLTKNAYFSLIIGILFGSFLVNSFKIMNTVSLSFNVMEESVNGSNIKVLFFLVLLGSIVSLINRTGVSSVYANFMSSKIKTKRGVLLLTSFFSTVFFLDDYFNCLTTGSIVTPLARHKKIFPGRIAHVIHSTAIPICILVPISSWAAAISSTFTDSGSKDGLSLFIKTIPYNFYAITALIIVISASLFDISFSTMRKEEIKFAKDSSKLSNDNSADLNFESLNSSKKELLKEFIFKLVLPLLFLIISSIFGLLYTGGITSGNDFLASIANCDSSTGLLFGAFLTYIFMFFLYVPILRIMKLCDFFNSIADGLKEMSSAVAVLVLAWSLGTLTSKYLKIGDIFTNILQSNMSVVCWLPIILFALAAILALSTGTSWGTFAILIPVAFPVLQSQNSEHILLSSLAAILSGAALGDNVSPISDTTVMASSSCKCNPLIHSFTQLPYAITGACISAFCFLLVGFISNIFILMMILLLLTSSVLIFVKKLNKLVINN